MIPTDGCSTIFLLFRYKGFTVGALADSGVFLMGAYANAVKCAVLLIVAVVFALGDGTFDAVIGMARILIVGIHSNHSYCFINRRKSGRRRRYLHSAFRPIFSVAYTVPVIQEFLNFKSDALAAARFPLLLRRIAILEKIG